MNACDFGSAFLAAVVLLIHFSVGQRDIAFGVSYADAVCFSGMAAAGAALAFDRVVSSAKPRRVALSILSVLSIGLFILYRTELQPLSDIAFALSSVPTGALISFLALLWFDRFAGERLEFTMLSFAICLAAGCCIAWLLLGMADQQFAFCYIASIGFACASAEKSLAGFARKDETARSPVLGTSLTPLMLSEFMLCLAAILSLSFAGIQAFHTDEIWLAAMPATLFASIAMLSIGRMKVSVLMGFAFVFVVSGLLLSSFLSVDSAIAFPIATNGLALSISLSIVLPLELAKDSLRQPHSIGALSLLAVFCGCIFGRCIAEFIMTNPATERLFMDMAAIIITVALVACIFASLSSKPLSGVVRQAFKIGDKTQAEEGELKKGRLQEYAKENGLGAREQEALSLLLERCSAREIAERMFIADGTAKAHIRHIYRKLGVNNRDDLFRVTEAVMNNNEARIEACVAPEHKPLERNGNWRRSLRDDE